MLPDTPVFVLHLYVTAILRTTMPLWEMMIGLVETLVLARLIGASIASIYNFGIRRHLMN